MPKQCEISPRPLAKNNFGIILVPMEGEIMGKSPIRAAIAEVFEEMAQAMETGTFGKRNRVGLTILGSEHGPEELVRGA